MDRVAIGIPAFGRQDPLWWGPLVSKVAQLPKQGIQFDGLILSTSMNTDHNRNSITRKFLNEYEDTEWLFWIDADTIVPDGAIRRMIDTGHKLVSGVYYGKGEKDGIKFPPIAYFKNPDSGGHNDIYRSMHWERGEIIPVDSAGAGCLLVHRTVFQDIRKEYTVLQRKRTGSLIPIKKDKMTGDLRNSHHFDGLTIDGVLHERLIEPTLNDWKFPYFALEFGTTEDFWFFNMAREVGHKLWLDTSVECGHLRAATVTGEDFRKENGLVPR